MERFTRTAITVLNKLAPVLQQVRARARVPAPKQVLAPKLVQVRARAQVQAPKPVQVRARVLVRVQLPVQVRARAQVQAPKPVQVRARVLVRVQVQVLVQVQVQALLLQLAQKSLAHVWSVDAQIIGTSTRTFMIPFNRLIRCLMDLTLHG